MYNKQKKGSLLVSLFFSFYLCSLLTKKILKNMMKRILSMLLICLPIALTAQTEAKYLEGAIPLVDGKVTFTTEMNVGTMSKELIYTTLLDWANNRFQPDEKFNDRVLFNDPEKGIIAIGGEEYLIFSSSALALDRTRIYYHMLINSEAGKCNITFTRIRYLYDESRDGGDKYVAEEWITDKWALNKSKTKLAPISGKFRKKTIDLKDELFKEIQATLGNKMIETGMQTAPQTPTPQVAVTPNPIVATTNTPEPVKSQPLVPLTPAIQVSEEKIPETNTPETIITQAIRMTITAGNDEQFEISKECWGGFGELFGKKVTFCLIDTQKTMGNLLMTQSDNYKISFYTPNKNQPALVIDCKKLMTQSINGEEAQKMSPSCENGKSYNMYVGEVLK